MDDTDLIRNAARALARVRGRSCLILGWPSLDPPAVQAVQQAVAERGGEIDVVLHGQGGCACCAYAIARELRRRFQWVGVVVPLAAKSAATLLSLAADEIVLGERGELEPLDAQISHKPAGDFPVERSCLEIARALEHVKTYALATFHEAVTSVVERSGMRAEDACRIAADLTGRLCQPLYAQVDLRTLGANLRANDTGAGYAERLLRRYRPELWARDGALIVERLVHAYPSHGFVIDAEELAELGVAARGATGDEREAVSHLASALAALPPKEPFIGLVDAAGVEREDARPADAAAPPTSGAWAA